ncbi:uncharacterized protein LOC129761958 [Toxorhynchites rutilus septentrionalis]|uniref:uncharacterized protein LOC129761958 n=1 Tax=Toxorhynchites rutilus septentrionalis TaxID=329112 RepID=UPI002478ACB4|nr:uncharacterized protein LOC129761958 [Toxorhynchites rutilus septentrionalis]
MDIDVDEFMLKSTAGYNFQYIDVKDLDRIIRNVTKNSYFQNQTAPHAPSAEARNTDVRMLSDGEIDEILRTTENDLKEELLAVDGNQNAIECQLELPEEFSDEASTVCSSSASSIVDSPARDSDHSITDEIADIEDNLAFGDDYCFGDARPVENISQSSEEKNRAEPLTSIETYFDFLDSETIVEEVILPPEDNDGDSEGSEYVAPVIKVHSPVKPPSALIRTYENQCKEPVNTVQPVFDFEAIERSSKSSPDCKSASQVCDARSNERMRSSSRKSLLDAFDTFIKITELQKKVCMLIDDIGHCLGKRAEPEDELEQRKLEKRTAEFQIRFQRNYLYQINRLEEDIHIIPKESAELAQKIYQLYRCIYQGLKFYLKNMKYFVIDVSPEKLWTLAKLIFRATKVCVQKKVFDDDDLIVEELYDKCHVLKTRLKEEVQKQKTHSKKSKQTKPSSSVASSSHVQVSKLSMYGATTPFQKKRTKINKSVNLPTKKTLTAAKPNPTKPPKAETVTKPQRGKITAVPIVQSSSSSLNCNKSSMRVRSVRTAAKPIDDVVTMVQQQSDPLANSRLLKEVSSALTKMSNSRDAAISPEVNQQLHQMIIDTIQNITRQQLNQLIPSLEVSERVNERFIYFIMNIF